MPEFKIDIKPGKNGDVDIEIDASGYVGGACLDSLDKFIENMRKNGIEVTVTNQIKKTEAGLINSMPGSQMSMR